MATKLYRSIDVWERLSETRLVCYRCFEVLPDHRFCVQSADFFDLPMDRPLSSGFLELLAEEAPDQRSRTYATLEEAVKEHKRDFSWADDLP